MVNKILCASCKPGPKAVCFYALALLPLPYELAEIGPLEDESPAVPLRSAKLPYSWPTADPAHMVSLTKSSSADPRDLGAVVKVVGVFWSSKTIVYAAIVNTYSC